MNKKDAKEQFDRVTKQYGIEHTFSFDEAWDFCEYKRNIVQMRDPLQFLPAEYTKEQFREFLHDVEDKMRASDKCVGGEEVSKFNPLKHSFADGCYIREVFNPKGTLLVTKRHLVKHPYFLMKGRMSILTEEGEKMIQAPHYGITMPGTKRIIYAHEDCIFVTVHATEETDISKIERQVVADDDYKPVEVEAL